DVDVAVAVPVVRVAVAANVTPFTSSNTVVGTLPSLAPASATGVGDVAVQVKYRFWKQEGGGFAAALRIRPPTGDSDQLRGSGITRTYVSGIWSKSGKLAPHAEVGYQFWSDKLPLSTSGNVFAKDEVIYGFGAEWTPNPRITSVLDVLGEHIRHGGRAGYQTFVVPGGGSFEALMGLPQGTAKTTLAPGIK